MPERHHIMSLWWRDSSGPVTIELVILQYAQAWEIRQLENQIDFFESFGYSKQTSNTPRRFAWEFPPKFGERFWLAGQATNTNLKCVNIA